MEKLNRDNGSNTYTNICRTLSLDEKTVILFQLIYALYLAQNAFDFIHGDLIGQNIYIERVPHETITYSIPDTDLVFKVPNQGINVKLIDFGSSQIRQTGSTDQFFSPECKYMTPYEKGWKSADLCKILNNPNMKIPQVDVLKEAFGLNNCKTRGRFFTVIPTFIELTPLDLFKSNLFSIFQ